MRILFLGDVVGRAGREAVLAALPKLRADLRVELAIVNGENASHGFGLAPDMARALFDAGADVITLGNHAWDRKEIASFIGDHPRLIRPLNFPPGTPGAGVVQVIDAVLSPPKAVVESVKAAAVPKASVASSSAAVAGRKLMAF